MKNKLLKSYLTGFILSILLTLLAYSLTVIHVHSYHEVISHEILIPTIIGIALIQLVVQMVFFLHLWQEAKPRWNLIFFVSTVSLILLIVVGSIWIMQHLNYNMTPSDMSNHLIKDEGIHH